MKRIYHQENSARHFRFNLKLWSIPKGASLFKNITLALWILGQVCWIGSCNSPWWFSSCQSKVHEISQRDQFLKKFRHEFKFVRSNLMGHDPSPSPGTGLNEMLHEELCCITQTRLKQQKVPSSTLNVAYPTQGKSRSRDLSKIQHYCH